jgi:hypothetical protein
MAVLIVISLLLVPGQGTVLAGVEVLAVGAAERLAIVAIHLLQLRHWRSLEEANLRWNFMGRVALGQAATLPFVGAGVAVLNWGIGGLYWLVAGVILSFLLTVVRAPAARTSLQSYYLLP